MREYSQQVKPASRVERYRNDHSDLLPAYLLFTVKEDIIPVVRV